LHALSLLFGHIADFTFQKVKPCDDRFRGRGSRGSCFSRMGQGLDRDAVDLMEELPNLYFQPAATFMHAI